VYLRYKALFAARVGAQIRRKKTMLSRCLERVAVLTLALTTLCVNGWPQEAPRGFSSQNGLLSVQQFDEARRAFELVLTPADGLGSHFNETSCVACHMGSSSRLPGGSGPVTELRAGFLSRSNEFIPAPGGTLITTKAVGAATAEAKALSNAQNVRDRFITPSLFGAGLVELIPDEALRELAKKQADDSDGRIRGLVREVPILEAPGQKGVGKFGWASQHASLLSFSAEAYRNEMGITSPLVLDDNTLLGDPVEDGVNDPEDQGGEFGVDVELFTKFMRALSAPPRLLPSDQRERREVEEGERVFESVGCALCHAPEFATLDEGEWVNGRTFRVPKALGNKKFHPYGDYLLHDIGTGPNILREGMPPEAKGRIRTAPLWGLGTRLANSEPLLHDGSASTLDDAIARHKNTAARVMERFQRLNERDRTRLLKFVRSL
jgi:CxxC motif-containing protein (DUF1111 family)